MMAAGPSRDGQRERRQQQAGDRCHDDNPASRAYPGTAI